LIITSAQNHKIKLVRALLASRKERERNRMFIVEGVRLAEEVMNTKVRPYLALYSRDLSERGFKVIEHLVAQGVDIEEVNSSLLNRISDTRSSQGILLVLPLPQESMCLKNQHVLVLDQLRNPGNVGTLLRSAVAMDFFTIILTPGSVDIYSPKVVRSSMGAHFRSHIFTMDAPEILRLCKKQNIPQLKIVLADAHAEHACWEKDLSFPLCLVIGSEAEGVTPELASCADERISIPMASGSESFNAAISGSILMYEIFRQRKTA